MTVVLVTGSAGFVGYHVCKQLLQNGNEVVGFDGMTEYYDVKLKKDRNLFLLTHKNFVFIEAMLERCACLPVIGFIIGITSSIDLFSRGITEV